jgi:type I restriction enzyme S subunit
MVNDTQQIPAGYKQTDVGVIPEDWDIKEIRDVTKKVIDNRGKTPPYKSDEEVELIETASISFVSNYPNYSKVTKFVSRDTYNSWFRDHPKKDDVLISTVGEYSGSSAIMGENRGTVAQNLIALRISSVDPKYFFTWTRSDGYVSQLRQVMMSQAQPSLKVPWLLDFKLAYPSKSDEQKKIASIISDIDSLISKLDQLIQKKKNIKQGAMQELLTGKRRLPGFSGEWVEKKLGDLIDLKNGYSFKSDNYLDGGAYSIVTIANVQRGYMDASHFNKIARLPNDIQAHQKLSINDLLISMTGNVGRVCRVTLSNCLLNQRVGKIESKGLNELYLFYLLNRSCFLEEMILKAQGGAQGNIGKNDILSYSTKITVNIDEQIAISRVLSDFDREIDTLAIRRDKFQKIKQGMMQQLLTGKIRLI